VRIGIVSPYSFDVPGGVQNHIIDLAEALIELGHEVSVLAPADEDADLPAYVVPAGRALPLPYNGSVARIAFSQLARKVQVEHLGGGAVEIPNGVAVRKFASAAPLAGWPGEGGALGFLGRFTESRKGFPILRTAFVTLAAERPGLRLLVAGPGDRSALLAGVPPDLHDRVEFLGLVSEPDKARMLRSVDVYVAPNTGGESFGMILTEAMAAGAAIAASDLEAFRRVLDGGRAGALFRTGDARELTALLRDLLDDPARRATLVSCARSVVATFDWPSVAERVLEVYATAIEATDGRVLDAEWAEPRPGT
jgi:phosphatidylinositol alpha-mannosyltransferase